MARVRQADSIRGFTLLEVLLAVVVLTVGSVLLLQAINTGLFAGMVNETEFIAVSLAQEKMEFFRNTAYASIAPEAKTDVSGFPAFQREVVVTDTTSQHNIKKIVVNIYYTIKSSELTTSLTTYVAS
jgi:prepilin-type N-terminal cleavage/methylation domain-containing protein